MKRTTAELVVLAMILVVIAYPAEASGPPRAIINCEGCNSIELTSSANYAAIAELGKTIKLKGETGYANYVWAKDGVVFAYGPEISVTITKSVRYSLSVTEIGGTTSDTRSVQINLASGAPKNNCVPYLAKIETGSTTVAVGDRVYVKTNYNEKECSDVVFHWEADEGIYIENPNAKKTWVTIKARPPSGKNPVIKAIVTNEIFRREQEISLTITDNTPPTVKNRYSYDPYPPLSHKSFIVSCADCQTGSGFNEAGDYISEFTAELLDMNRRVISSGTTTAGQGQALSGITLVAGDEGRYFLRVKAKDSHGLSSNNDMEEIFVVFGNTEDDAPYIVINDTVYCDPGKSCVFDISKTETHGLGLYINFGDIVDIKNPATSKTEPLFSIYGNTCRSVVCTTVFQNPGDRKIKITAQYMRNGRPSGKISEKIVAVIFQKPEKAIPVPAQTAKQVSPSVPLPLKTVKLPAETPPDISVSKPVPGASPLVIFAAIIFVAVSFRRRKNKH